MSRRNDLTGKRFGRWEAVSFSQTIGKKSYWNCRCIKCGTMKECRTDKLTAGRGISCPGCSSILPARRFEEDMQPAGILLSEAEAARPW